MIEVTRDITPQQWDEFVRAQPVTPFVQAPQYGAFYESLGEQSWILGVFDEGELVGGSLIVSTHAKRGNFLYLPYGPLFAPQASGKAKDVLLGEIQQLARAEKMDFVRISPAATVESGTQQWLQTHGYRPAPIHVLAENSWLLSLKQNEEEILGGMKKNHRNLIRRCEREGVSVAIDTTGEQLEVLHELLDETEKRHNFTRFSRTYINTEFSLFAQKGEAALFIARLPDGRVDSAAIIMFYGSMAVYRHSGSYNLDKKVPTSYAIQWKVIQEAKNRGMMWYNFWGVNPADEPQHPFAGIGHFKRGFGGEQVDFVHCHDLPLTWKYWVNYLVETVRAKKRGFSS